MITLGKIGCDGVQFCCGLLQSRIRFEPPDRGKRLVISAREKIMIRTQISQQQETVAVARKANSLWHNADDLARNSIDIQSLADDGRRCAETRPPNSLADQRHFRCARSVIALDEVTADQWRDLQDRQIICGDARRTNCLRRRFSVKSRKADALRPCQSKIGEALLRTAPVEIIHVTD